MPRLGRTRFIRREFRRTLDTDRPSAKTKALRDEQARQEQARRASRGYV